jgi:uncharacterized protein (DUF3820 family)
MKIPFGKFSDWEVDDLPRWYLDWLVQQKWMSQKFPRLADAVKVRLEDLDGNNDTATTMLTTDLLKQWHRRLILRWHPDRPGGSHDGMVAANYAVELLRDMLGVSA